MPAMLDCEERWRQFLTVGEPSSRHFRRAVALLPSEPRCKACNAPFKGPGGMLMRLIGKPQSTSNPYFCNPCGPLFEQPGGAEVELTLLFADVRGSTSLAGQMSPSQYSHLMKRFYHVSTDILIHSDALIDKLVGDQVMALYLPGFAGPNYARRAVEAAQILLEATGHGSAEGPWLPVGVGIHTGVAYVGVVRGVQGTTASITALGDPVNIAARLVGLAGPGEIVISDETYSAAGLKMPGVKQRQLDLKGKDAPFGVHVWRQAEASLP